MSSKCSSSSLSSLMPPVLETSVASIEMKDSSFIADMSSSPSENNDDLNGSITLQTQVESNSIVKVHLLDSSTTSGGADGDNYLIVARERWIDVYLLIEEDNHLSKSCSIRCDLQIVDLILDQHHHQSVLLNTTDIVCNNIYVLCSDGSVLLTTLSYHQDANIFTFSSWNTLASAQDNLSSNFPVKLLLYNQMLAVVYIENEIQFINLSNNNKTAALFQYSGVHFDSCVLGNYLYLCINSTLVFKMKFNEECNLVESEKIQSPYDILSLKVCDSSNSSTGSTVIAITADSRLLSIETLDQLLRIETSNDQLISDYQQGYLCTENGDVYSIVESGSSTTTKSYSLLYTNLGIDKLCLLKPVVATTEECNNFLIGYSSVSDLMYIPLVVPSSSLESDDNDESMQISTQLPPPQPQLPRSLLPTISHVTDFDRKGEDFIVATPKGLCSVKKGMSCRVTSLTDESYDGIDNVFTPTPEFIILSFVNQSKVLRISEDSIDECNNNVFESSQTTCYCSQLLDSFIVQVTANEIRLMDLQLRTLLSSVKINNTVVTSQGNNIYTSYENKLTKFQVITTNTSGNNTTQEGGDEGTAKIIESFSMTLDRDISSMRAIENNQLIVSTYSGIIYFINAMNGISKTIDINSVQTKDVETNIVESIFYYNNNNSNNSGNHHDGSSLLLLGLRDGHLLVYDLLNDQPQQQQLLVKKFKLGDVPVQLQESFDDSIIAVSNNCYHISVDSSNKSLNISNLLVHDRILSVQNFNVPSGGYENSLLCLSSDCKIKVICIETTNFQPMIKEIYSTDDCQRVHVNQEDNSIIYVCNNYSTLRFISDYFKETLTLYTFSPSEKIYSISSFRVKNEDAHDSNFIIVGTKYSYQSGGLNNIIMNKDPSHLSHGMLHVLKLGKVSDQYKCEHVGSCELPFMVYAMKQYNNEHLLVAYGDRLGLFHFDQKEMKLLDQANVRHFVNSIDVVCGAGKVTGSGSGGSSNLIAITDRFDGLLFYIIQDSKFYYLNNVSSMRLDALNSATCRFIGCSSNNNNNNNHGGNNNNNTKLIVTIDRSHQLIVWKINYVNASMHTISVSKEKSFDTKELALKVQPISSHQLFYITLNGSINYLNIDYSSLDSNQ